MLYCTVLRCMIYICPDGIGEGGGGGGGGGGKCSRVFRRKGEWR